MRVEVRQTDVSFGLKQSSGCGDKYVWSNDGIATNTRKLRKLGGDDVEVKIHPS